MAEIEVRFFAAAIDAAGTSKTVVELDPATVGQLKTVLADRYGERMAHICRVAAYLIGDDLIRDEAHPVGTRVDVLPPFAGG